MEFSEVIAKRISIRKYKDTPVEPEKIAQLMEWLRIAPSAANRQEWKFVAVTDPLIFCICATEYQEMNDSGYNRGTIDCSIASTYLHLGTFALGLGSCWVGSFDPDMATEIVGCPEGTRVVTVVTAGYADEDPAPRSRKAVEDVAVYDRF